jgi:hypothetical protein
MFARIGIMRALNRHVERVFDPSRKDTRAPQVEERRITRARLSFNEKCLTGPILCEQPQWSYQPY